MAVTDNDIPKIMSPLIMGVRPWPWAIDSMGCECKKSRRQQDL